jgi:rhodanese-related sulfurtransferase
MGRLAEFASNHPFHVLSVLIALFAVVFYEIRLMSRGQTQVSANEAVKLINRGAMVIDVRKPEDFGGGHILNAKNIELAKLESDPAAVKKRKNKIMVTVCDSGTQSARAANLLRKAGFEHVYSMKSGLGAWRSENLPLVK